MSKEGVHIELKEGDLFADVINEDWFENASNEEMQRVLDILIGAGY